MSRSDSYPGEHTKYPPLISCLTWGNVWTMLEVFPDGWAVCRHNAGNKTSSSSIIQLVSKPRLPFWFYLGYLTSNSVKIFPTRMSNCFLMSVSAKQIIGLNDYALTRDCCHHPQEEHQQQQQQQHRRFLAGESHISTQPNDHNRNNRDRNKLHISWSLAGWYLVSWCWMKHANPSSPRWAHSVTPGVSSGNETNCCDGAMHSCSNHEKSDAYSAKPPDNQSAWICNTAQTRTSSNGCNGYNGH